MAAPLSEPGKSGTTTNVSFVCQRCLQPLKLDTSFNTIEQRLFDELTAPLTRYNDEEEEETINITTKRTQLPEYEEDGNIVKRIIPSSGEMQLNLSHDFTLLGDPGPGSMDNLSHRLKVTACLFDIMSGQSEVDHPLCEECTDSLLDQLDNQLKITEDECRDYRDLLTKLQHETDDVDEKALDKELKQLKAEEETLHKELAKAEEEQKIVVAKLQEEEDKSKILDEEEEKYWKEYNEYKRQALELDDEQRSIANQLQYAQTQLDKLKKTNVFNSTFHIWHSGQFGTINNFRLGRLPSVPVDWNEINAAWGQTVLLLHSLARKMNLTFQRYRLVPYGNHSYLESLTEKNKELPLYGSGGFRFLWDTKFDQAMVAFLDCLQQFKEEVERGDTSFCLPYRMEKGKIEDSNSGNSYSIKIQFNSEEQWTKALKFMLTNLKWGLAWVSSQLIAEK
ncbi:beclin-1 [Patella vulgata]|uniref:beclin-1 n=1 Tax=Patella vulgata TaxID=6465 RepID=UPI0021809773|nr:beclin-1 [Patella vulgata]